MIEPFGKDRSSVSRAGNPYEFFDAYVFTGREFLQCPDIIHIRFTVCLLQVGDLLLRKTLVPVTESCQHIAHQSAAGMRDDMQRTGLRQFFEQGDHILDRAFGHRFVLQPEDVATISILHVLPQNRIAYLGKRTPGG